MKFGIIIETKEHEKAWNAFRFANASKNAGHNIKIFLMGEAVECESQTHNKFNVSEQFKAYVDDGGEILACGTCIRSRKLEESTSCPISTMNDCIQMVEWADRVITF